MNNDFDRLEIGTGVRFDIDQDLDNVHASSVKIVDKPGASVGKAEHTLIEPPLDWKN